MASEKGQSGAEQRQLLFIKAGLLVMVLVFVYNALMANMMPEVFPVTRWAMYSLADDPILETTDYTIETIAVDGDTYSASAADLFRRTGISKTWKVGQKVLFDAINIYNLDIPERQADAQAIIRERLAKIYDTEIAEVRVWKTTYDISLFTFPHMNETPAQQVIVASFAD